MSFFKPKIDMKVLSLVIKDNEDRKVHLVHTPSKQKTGSDIFRALVPEID